MENLIQNHKDGKIDENTTTGTLFSVTLGLILKVYRQISILNSRLSSLDVSENHKNRIMTKRLV